MFERSYALRALEFADGEATDAAINAFVAEHDHGRNAASVAAMTCNATHLFVLVEFWRETGAVDATDQGTTPADRPARRPRARQRNNAGAAVSDQPSSESDVLGDGAAGRLRPHARQRRAKGREPARNPNEIDVPLPFGEALPDGPVEWPK